MEDAGLRNHPGRAYLRLAGKLGRFLLLSLAICAEPLYDTV